jgi:hypothetical protein
MYLLYIIFEAAKVQKVFDASFHPAMPNMPLEQYSFLAVAGAVSTALIFSHLLVATVSAMSFNIVSSRVDDVMEGQDVEECSSNVQTFRTEVFTDLTMNLTTLKPEEIDSLEDIFMTSYDQLSYQVCDSFFCLVANATLSVGQTNNIFPNWRLQEGTADDSATVTSMGTSDIGATVFTVTGQCRNCLQNGPGTFGLFDDTF